MTLKQLTFDLPARRAYLRDDFFVSRANRAALAAVEGWRDWPGQRLLLIGPKAAGKTHLAQIWADLSGARVISGRDVGQADLPDLCSEPVAVEDADLVAGQRDAENALFHLYNLAGQLGQPLLLTASAPPRDWGLRLDDLHSRLAAMPVARLLSPDDALLSAVLVKLFSDRQIVVPANLIRYLISRMDRSIAAAGALVAALDARALSKGGPISRNLAAEVLDSAALG